MYPIQNKLASTREKQGNLLKAEEDSRKQEKERQIANGEVVEGIDQDTFARMVEEGREPGGAKRRLYAYNNPRISQAFKDDLKKVYGSTLLSIKNVKGWNPEMMRMSRKIDKMIDGSASQEDIDKAKKELIKN